MFRKSVLALALVLAAAVSVSAAVDTSVRVNDSRVRSLQVQSTADAYPLPGVPAMLLGDDMNGIVVSFDILAEDRDYLRYDLIHCNADWQPSSLAYVEYLDGFNEGIVPDGEFSQATNVHYLHYSIAIPNGDMRPLVSGNYLLRVYSEDKSGDEPLLQCRFAVTEQTVDISPMVTSRTDVDYNRSHQQLGIMLDTRRSDVRDPFADLTVTVSQNGRTDNAVTLQRPLRVSGTRSYYEHDPRLIFKAGNEYRRFETVSVHNPNMGIDAIEWISPYYHAFVQTDGSRAGESYHYDETLNGAYVVREYNSQPQDWPTAADYLVTHFTLDYPELPAHDIYIDGDFVQRRFGPESRMSYNPETRRYEKALLLKQGAYSYQYLVVPKGQATGRTDIVEGDKYETRNRYNIYVYCRRPGDRYDRLVGVSRIMAN